VKREEARHEGVGSAGGGDGDFKGEALERSTVGGQGVADARSSAETRAEASARESGSGSQGAGSSDAVRDDAVIEELRDAVARKTLEVDALKAQCERLKAAAAQSGRLQAAYANVDETEKRLTKELEEKSVELADARRASDTAHAERAKAEEECAKRDEEVKKLKTELHAALKKALSANEELRKLKLSAKSAEDELEAERERLSEALDAKTIECKRVKDELEARCDAADARVKSLEAQVAVVQKSLEDVTLERDDYATKVSALESDAARLREELNDLSNASSTVSSPDAPKSADFDAECESLERIFKAEEAELSELRAALDARTEELRASREKEEALGVALNDAEAQIVESRKNVDLIVARAEKASQLFTENASALRMANAKAATAQVEITVAELRAKELQDELDATAAAYDELKVKYDEVVEQRDKATSAAQVATANEQRLAMDSLERSLEGMTRERDTLKSDLGTATLECTNMRAELDALKANLANARTQASPVKIGASQDVIEALESERRARALYQTDARYWRERYEALVESSHALGSSTSTPPRAVTATHRTGFTPGKALAIAAGVAPVPRPPAEAPAEADEPASDAPMHAPAFDPPPAREIEYTRTPVRLKPITPSSKLRSYF
jgi:chromosome segregation ATPase